MWDGKIIITGTGRAGTSFLMHLLTELGLDTGFAKEQALDPVSRAGFEIDYEDFKSGHCPRIVKGPWLCDKLEDLLSTTQQKIDLAIVPIRNLQDAAESRRVVHREGGQRGGLWGTDDPDMQEQVLMRKFYRLMNSLAFWEVPTLLLSFPRLVTNPDYLYKKLIRDNIAMNVTMGEVTFKNAFAKVCKKNLSKAHMVPAK